MRRHGAAVWPSLIKPMLVLAPPPPPSTPTSVWDRSAPLQVSVTYSNDVRGRRSGLVEGPDALTRLRESQKAAARAGRRAKAASACPLAAPSQRYRRLLYRLTLRCGGWK